MKYTTGCTFVRLEKATRRTLKTTNMIRAIQNGTHLEKIQQRGLVWTATARLTRDRARRARDAASGTYVTFAPAGGKLRRDSPFGYGST